MITLSVPRPVTLSGSPSDERVSLDVALSMAVVASTSSTLSTDRVGLDSQHAAAALITRSSWYPTMAVALLPYQVAPFVPELRLALRHSTMFVA
jgi:hypothetical protein